MCLYYVFFWCLVLALLWFLLGVAIIFFVLVEHSSCFHGETLQFEKFVFCGWYTELWVRALFREQIANVKEKRNAERCSSALYLSFPFLLQQASVLIISCLCPPGGVRSHILVLLASVSLPLSSAFLSLTRSCVFVGFSVVCFLFVFLELWSPFSSPLGALCLKLSVCVFRLFCFVFFSPSVCVYLCVCVSLCVFF